MTVENELRHYGVLGMKWGVRRYQNKDGTLTSAGRRRQSKQPDKLEPSSTDSAVTKRVKNDYNTLSDSEFSKKYQGTKKRYAKRVQKYGDPYMKAPLARFGKHMAEKNKKRSSSMNPNYSTDRQTVDRATLGVLGVKRVNNLMNKGVDYKRAYSRVRGEVIATSLLATVGTLALSTAIQNEASGAAAYKRAYRKANPRTYTRYSGWGKMAKETKKGQSAVSDVLQLMGSDKYIWLDPSKYKVL